MEYGYAPSNELLKITFSVIINANIVKVFWLAILKILIY